MENRIIWRKELMGSMVSVIDRLIVCDFVWCLTNDSLKTPLKTPSELTYADV